METQSNKESRYNTPEKLEKERLRGRAKYKKNRDKYLAKGKEYKSSPRGLDLVLKRTYSIGLEEYNLMFGKQGGCCAICGKHQSKFKRRLDVDHDHSTGFVRGLLCHKCNRGLGYFLDSPIFLTNAVNYLNKAYGRQTKILSGE